MARMPRKTSKTGYYHIMMRGNNKEFIFEKDIDKRYFLKLLKTVVEEGLISVAAWCIMDNHVHLIIKSEPKELAKSLASINTKFAMKYNNKNERIGHVFQERFKSQVIEDEKYLLKAIRYVHQNPVSADIVSNISEYKWSSYNLYLFKTWSENMSFVMKLFDNNIESFIKFHRKHDNQKHLEVKEDLINIDIKKVNRLIEYHSSNGKENLSEEKLIKDILNNTELTNRNIAGILKVSYSKVQRISKK